MDNFNSEKRVHFQKDNKESLNGDWFGSKAGQTATCSDQDLQITEKAGRMTLNVKPEVLNSFEKAPTKHIQDLQGTVEVPSISKNIEAHGSISYKAKSTAEETVEEIKSSSWRNIMFEYAQNSSFHGLRQITEPQPFLLRRLLWLAVFLASAAVLLVQMALSVNYYISWPVAVDVKINYNDTIIFPAVTLCNENAFRTSEAYRYGYYKLIGDLFSGDEPNADLNYYNAANLSLEELYKKTAYNKDDFIVSCEWESVECASNAFRPVFTDFGLCYTFNAGLRGYSLKLADSTGSEGGLKLQLNIEQYQYMHGPNEGAGLKVLVHNSDEIPLVRDHGLAIAPGSHAFIAAKTVQVNNLPPRHGKCNDSVVLDYFDKYSVDSCYTNCKEIFLQKTCGCRDVYMPDNGGLPKVCTLHQYQTCMLDALMEFNNIKDTCNCPIPCERLVYEPVISYASSSNFDIDALLRQRSTEELENKYVRAREINQKVDQGTVTDDTKQITAFVKNVIKMTSGIDKITEILQNAEDSIESSYNRLNQRIDIHLTKGLEQIRDIIDQSFVQGWEEFKQKTFHMVVFDYDGLAMSLKRGIKEGERTIPPDDPEMRQLIYLPMESRLRRRRELLDETVELLKIVNKSYEFATPIKPLPESHYDEAYLSEELMSYNEVNLVEYVYNTAQYAVRTHQMNMLMKNVQMMYSGLDDLLQAGDYYVRTGEFDETLFKYGYKNFTKGSNNFNYRLFMFENRVIQVHKLLMESKITEFKLHKRTLGNTFVFVKRMIDDLKFSILSSKDEYWNEIIHLKNQSEKYLENPNAHKTPLAKMVTSKQVDVSVKSIHTFFSTILLKIEDLQKGIASLHLAYEVVWKSIISEPVTKKFYSAIHDDVEQLHLLKEMLLSPAVSIFRKLNAKPRPTEDDEEFTVDLQRTTEADQEVTVDLQRTTEADQEVTVDLQRTTEADQEVTVDLQRTTEADQEVTVDLQRTTEADQEVTVDLQRTTEADQEVTVDLQRTTEADQEVTVDLQRTTEADQEVTVDLQRTTEADQEVTVDLQGTTEADQKVTVDLQGTTENPRTMMIITNATNTIQTSIPTVSIPTIQPTNDKEILSSKKYEASTKSSEIEDQTLIDDVTKQDETTAIPTQMPFGTKKSTEIQDKTTDESMTLIEKSTVPHKMTTKTSGIQQPTTELPILGAYTTTLLPVYQDDISTEEEHYTTIVDAYQFTTIENMITTSESPQITMSPMEQYDDILFIFSNLLLDNFPVEDLRPLSVDEISSRINGDIPSMNLSLVLENLNKEFSALNERIAEMSQVAESDEQFMTSFELYRSSLNAFMDRNQINPRFYRENFMRLDIYMQELRYEEISQQKAYDIIQLLGDIGGSMGLFIGGSLLSVIELFDVFLHNGAKRCFNKP